MPQAGSMLQPSDLERAASHTRIRAARTVRFVSVVLPCLNEEDAVGATVQEARRGLEAARVDGEVIVVDNGSRDDSVARAREAGANVLFEARRGYGAAHLAGVRAARGDVVVMADADQTYDLERLTELLSPLRAGADMVVASRLRGHVSEGAMPFLHRWVGTPVFNVALRLLTGATVSDTQSGYRAFWRDIPDRLGLEAPGMEYASEMLLKAARSGLVIEEVPTDYRVRVGETKLRTFSDGWRHLRMLLLLCPHLTLMVPGLVAMALGLLISLTSVVASGRTDLFGVHWSPVFIGPMLLVIGAQAILLGALAAYRSPLTPARTRARLSFLGQRRAADQLLTMFLIVAGTGAFIDFVLFLMWVTDRSTDSVLGIAGLAQALILIGVNGLVAMLAAEYSRDNLVR